MRGLETMFNYIIDFYNYNIGINITIKNLLIKVLRYHHIFHQILDIVYNLY
jgi:hypothetical protein